MIRNLITCARDGGNYLLNIGPEPDGSIPPESVRILSEVGQWMKTGGADDLWRRSLPRGAQQLWQFHARWKPALHACAFWPGDGISISGLKQKVTSATVLKTGQRLTVSQDGFRTLLTVLRPRRRMS